MNYHYFQNKGVRFVLDEIVWRCLLPEYRTIFITQNEVQMVIPKLSRNDAFQFQIEGTVIYALIEDNLISYYGAGATL